MSDERLNGLPLMSIEEEIAVSIDLNKIVNEFALYNNVMIALFSRSLSIWMLYNLKSAT
jgi:hypothetical protein